MNIFYFLIALFFIVPLSVRSMHPDYPTIMPLDQSQCPGSPLNSRSIIESLFSPEQIHEYKTTQDFKKPISPSAQSGEASGSAASAKKNIHCYSNQPITHVNPNHYAICNYPNCKVIVHKSFAREHITTHLNNDVNYRKTDPKLFYTPLSEAKTVNCQIGNTKEAKNEPQPRANNTIIEYKLLN